MVFVNSRSGGQSGKHLLLNFKSCLSNHQVFDIFADRGPKIGLEVLQKTKFPKNWRILVCGGDGTVGWVLSALEETKLSAFPPIAILPLGTGNDLARTLGWGTGYGGEDISPILHKIEEAMIVNLDRWCIHFVTDDLLEAHPKDIQFNESTSEVQPPKYEKKMMNNYMSIGVDAEVALEFHNLRNEQPELFTSQFINKFWYTHYGFKATLLSQISDLRNVVTLVVDQKEVLLPPGVGGIMILNLPSYAGGANLWGTEFDPQVLISFWFFD